MTHRVVLSIALNLLLLWTVSAIRVSPKLDFEEPEREKGTGRAGFRPDVGTRNLRGSTITKSIEHTNLDSIGVVCISGNCSATKVNSDADNGISADVLVHIKTNVDVKPKNDTVQAVPDVPVVVGSKSSTIPTIESVRPISVINPTIPPYGFVPPVPPRTGFVPSIGPGFVQNRGLQTDSLTKGFPNYAPGFQGNSNDLPPPYLQPPFNSNNNNNNDILQVPPMTWHPRRSGVGGYNPVEFRKIYPNTWTLVKSSRSDFTTNTRRSGSGISRWTPCICQNSEVHQYPTTPGYNQRSQPAGVSGKLEPLA